MLLFKTHNYFLFSRYECWFYKGESISIKGYTTFIGASKLANDSRLFTNEHQTSIIDLTKSEEELFQSIHSTYRYDIRQAEKSDATIEFINKPSRKDCKELLKQYNLFANELGLAQYKLSYLLALQKQGCLRITSAQVSGEMVVTHAYVSDDTNVLLLLSFHSTKYRDKKLRSELNKKLHWEDFCEFKRRSHKLYDFGGLNSEKLPGITKFKMSFGGTTVQRYRYATGEGFVQSIVRLIKKVKG